MLGCVTVAGGATVVTACRVDDVSQSQHRPVPPPPPKPRLAGAALNLSYCIGQCRAGSHFQVKASTERNDPLV